MASKKKLTPAQKAAKNKLQKLTDRLAELETENMHLKLEKDEATAFKTSLKAFLEIDDLVDGIKDEIREGIDTQISDEVYDRVSELSIS